MAYGDSDDYCAMAQKIEKARKLIGLAKNEILDIIIESNVGSEEKLELISYLLEFTNASGRK